MRRRISIVIAMCMLFTLSGCFGNNEKKEEVAQTEDVKSVTVQGKIIDVTSTHFSIVTSANKEYEFNRTEMQMKDGELEKDFEIQVSYIVKDGVMYAQKGTILENEVSTDDQRQSIDDIISQMSIEEKVGQMFFVRSPEDDAMSDVASYHLGGYILFDKDFHQNSYQEVVDSIASYQSQAKIPLLIGVDEEGGSVVRLSKYTAFRGVPFWSPQNLYNYGGYDLIRSDTIEKATLLKNIGINVNLAPVADVSIDPNDFINARSFGKNATETATYVATVVSIMKENNLGSTLKHFPGYGNNVDTHTGISVDKRTYENFVESDFLPFIAGIEAGVDSILVSHNIMTCVDKDGPASLSSKVHEILRNELGFQGVIMTDDLAMDAIKDYIDSSAAAINAINAGNDMLICSDYRKQIPAVLEAIEQGEIDVKQLDVSVKRILTWKANMGLIDVK
ncbi:glycoside hydrolase family 3 protein [Amedibacillus sp. YH-ame6]